ncbi:acyl-CoA dehydrogenase family member 11-like [Argiope bruennichi]|uniref:acyl-CoA dehydrogenase family member 11-like n=1 Tax=Argiope bruennichi TaxID=94029 RepID=UPI0024953231|nr:acyl-CoA dehydrogenase family member 11-like [Argiope bruennichi]
MPHLLLLKRASAIHRSYFQPVRFSFTKSEEIKHLSKQQLSKGASVKFSQAEHGQFYQERPIFNNPFLSDAPLQSFLNHYVPKEVSIEISQDLKQFGQRIINEIDDLGWECELNPPTLETQDVWGRRVDDLKICTAWKKMHSISAEEGLIAISYERKLDYWSRLHQICKAYMFNPSSGLYSCPLAMTDGAAKTIMSSDKSVVVEKKEFFEKAFNNLISRDPQKCWTSGQWMTEKRGGSDVANGTETIAIPDNDFYRLYGYKWFSSASDANIALTLARIVQNSEVPKNETGLTMFCVETRNSEGQFNNIQMVKLKNKLGTRGLPTAELLLDGCIAYKMSQEGRGIASISHMLNTTRVHNSLSSVGYMRKILLLSRDYSRKRVAFGRTLSETPLHMRILSNMEIETRGSLLLLLKVAVLLGKNELGINSADERLLLRLLSPVMKLYTAKQAIAVVSEGLETFGGQGYMEDSRLPVLLRDVQVCSIWEGTTNVMSLDVIRSLLKTNSEALLSLEKNIIICLENGKKESTLQESCMKIEKSMKYISAFIKENPGLLHIAARDISYSLARTYIGALLIENATITKKTTDIFTVQQWCKMQELCPLHLHQNYSSYTEKDYETVMEDFL